jgi:hypothetical protein
VWIDDSRPDYPFVGYEPDFLEVDVQSLDHYAFLAIFFTSPEVPYDGSEKYAGSVLLQVDPGACGLAVFGFDFRTSALDGTPDGLLFRYFRLLRISLPDCDCNENGVADSEEISGGAGDCDHDYILDQCEPDCDGDGVIDDCVLADCTTDEPECSDCNSNGVPDGCDIVTGGSADSNEDGVPDECFIPIPTASSWGLLIMMLVILTVAKLGRTGLRNPIRGSPAS